MIVRSCYKYQRVQCKTWHDFNLILSYEKKKGIFLKLQMPYTYVDTVLCLYTCIFWDFLEVLKVKDESRNKMLDSNRHERYKL